jgi:hypothetical protein
MLASGLIAGGMSWWQAILTMLLGNLIVLVPMLLNAHAGTRYGIPFPVFVRASFGVKGANVPAVLRALVACGWFGIQTCIGGHGGILGHRGAQHTGFHALREIAAADVIGIKNDRDPGGVAGIEEGACDSEKGASIRPRPAVLADVERVARRAGEALDHGPIVSWSWTE